MDVSKIVKVARLIDQDPSGVALRLSESDGVSRQAASAMLAKLRKQGLIATEGHGRGTTYRLLDTVSKSQSFPIAGLSEDVVWREFCAPVVADLPDNVRNIWHHGITEMVNNAIDHSGADNVSLTITRNALFTEVWIRDGGEGIFLKIQRAMNLYATREALLELSKGKFTTDPARHSGEGIFFTSKMFDRFSILSGKLVYLHDDHPWDYLAEDTKHMDGTTVVLRLCNDSTQTASEVFDRFASPDEYSFSKTTVPVRLAQYEGEKLVSRSQAKRLTRRFEKFRTVLLDFSGVDEIGQAFADEVFRVFRNAHPEIEMSPIRASRAVALMISRVLSQ